MRYILAATLLLCFFTYGFYQTSTIGHRVGIGLGPELVSNGDFTDWTGDDPDDWTVVGEDGPSYVTESSGACRLVSDGTTTEIQQIILDTSKDYLVTFNISAITGTIAIRWGSGLEQNYNSTGDKIKDISPTQTTFVIKRVTSCDATFDNVSVREIL